ncbi:MAG: hypothetical protein RL190_87 [Actinomycetota bacterium]|jgi:small basic protein (TIGR04137 family)
MSLHRSLKTKSGALNQHRNVLTRAERIAKLKEEERFDTSKGALGLVKVRSIKVAAGKKPKKAEAEGAEGAKPAAGAAKAAPAAKAAAPKK